MRYTENRKLAGLLAGRLKVAGKRNDEEREKRLEYSDSENTVTAASALEKSISEERGIRYLPSNRALIVRAHRGTRTGEAKKKTKKDSRIGAWVIK